MWSKLVDSSQLYSNVIDAARQFGYVDGCPIAESIAERLITLPNHASLSVGDVETVASTFKSSLQACRRTRTVAAPQV